MNCHFMNWLFMNWLFMNWLFMKSLCVSLALDGAALQAYITRLRKMLSYWITPFVTFAALLYESGAILNPERKNSSLSCTKRLPSSTASCFPIDSSVCLSATLPYNLTSIHLAKDSSSYKEVLAKLQRWSGLRSVPRCWEVVQPFLCAVYFPRCEQAKDGDDYMFIYPPDRGLCERTREPCKIVDLYGAGWPEFLQCDKYDKECHFDVNAVRYNTTSTCQPPLISTANPKSWFPGVDGCALPCKNVFYTEQEHEQVHLLVCILGGICFVSTLFTMLTFICDWSTSNHYPSVIIFFINACFFLGSVGWLAQWIPGARRDVVCRVDGTARKSEPQLGFGETAACSVIFVLIYGFTMAAVTWFVILTYAWNRTYKAFSSSRDVIASWRGHFHLIAWSLPLVLTIACLAVTQIDGDSLTGICVVNYTLSYRAPFVLVPIGLALAISLIFLIKGMVTLVQMQSDSPGLMPNKASARIRETITRLGIFACCSVLFVSLTFVVHIYTFINEPSWKKSLQEYLICLANQTTSSVPLISQSSHSSAETSDHDQLPSTSDADQRGTSCQMSDRPNLIARYIEIIVYFMTGILMSSWVWNKPTLRAWKGHLKKLFCITDDTVLSGVIGKSPSKKDVNVAGSLRAMSLHAHSNNMRESLSFVSNPVDPLAINYDLTSVSSRDFSSTTWSAAASRSIIVRRSGQLHPLTNTTTTGGRQRRFSDSDVLSISSLCEQLDVSAAAFCDNRSVTSRHGARRSALSTHPPRSSYDASPVSTLAPPSSIDSDTLTTVVGGTLSGGAGGKRGRRKPGGGWGGVSTSSSVDGIPASKPRPPALNTVKPPGLALLGGECGEGGVRAGDVVTKPRHSSLSSVKAVLSSVVGRAKHKRPNNKTIDNKSDMQQSCCAGTKVHTTPCESRASETIDNSANHESDNDNGGAVVVDTERSTVAYNSGNDAKEKSSDPHDDMEDDERTARERLLDKHLTTDAAIGQRVRSIGTTLTTAATNKHNNKKPQNKEETGRTVYEDDDDDDESNLAHNEGPDGVFGLEGDGGCGPLLSMRSDYSIASSDTDALSIKLDSDYQPVGSSVQLGCHPISSNVQQGCQPVGPALQPIQISSEVSQSVHSGPVLEPTQTSSEVVVSLAASSMTAETTVNSSTQTTSNLFCTDNYPTPAPPLTHPLSHHLPPHFIYPTPSATDFLTMSSPYHYPPYSDYMTSATPPHPLPYNTLPPNPLIRPPQHHHLEMPIWPPYGVAYSPYYYHTSQYYEPPPPPPLPRQFLSYPPSYYSHMMNFDPYNLPPTTYDPYHPPPPPTFDLYPPPPSPPSNPNRQQNTFGYPPSTAVAPSYPQGPPTLLVGGVKGAGCPIDGPIRAVRGDRGPMISRSVRRNLTSPASAQGGGGDNTGVVRTPPGLPTANLKLTRVVTVAGGEGEFRPSLKSQFRPLTREGRLAPPPLKCDESCARGDRLGGERREGEDEEDKSLLEMVDLMTPYTATEDEEEEEEDEEEGEETEEEEEGGREGRRWVRGGGGGIRRRSSSIDKRMHDWLNSIEVESHVPVQRGSGTLAPPGEYD